MTLFSSVKAKLLGIIFLALTCLALTSLVTTYRLNNNINEYDFVIHTTLNAQKVALSANLEFKRQVQEWKNVLIRGADDAQMDKYWKRFGERHDSTQAFIEELIPLLQEKPELQTIARDFLSTHNAMKTAYGIGRQQYIDSKFDINTGDKAVSGIDREPSSQLDEIVDQLNAIALAKSTEVEASAHASIFYSNVALILFLILILFISFIFLEKIIVKPLTKVQLSLKHIANGKLNKNCDYHSGDEIGKIADSARQLQDFLFHNVETMTQTSKSLSDASDQMQIMAEALNQHAGEQMDATEQVATAVQQMSHSASDVADNSQQTSEITQNTSTKASEGSTTANSAQSSATNLVKELDTSAEVIRLLAENAANVGSVLDVIRGIAEQTNLLALNAAIEAARAGDLGRGFAVVADEVRTLAQRTQTSTLEIEKILESVKSGADKAVIAMDKGQSISQEVEQQITAATQVLTEIFNMVNDINDKNIQIAGAANEQSGVANEISSLIQNIHGLSESTHERVDKSRAISKDLKELIEEFNLQISRFEL